LRKTIFVQIVAKAQNKIRRNTHFRKYLTTYKNVKNDFLLKFATNFICGENQLV